MDNLKKVSREPIITDDQALADFMTVADAYAIAGTFVVRLFNTKHFVFQAATHDLKVTVFGSVDSGATFPITAIAEFTVIVGTPQDKTLTDYYTDVQIQVKPAVAGANGKLSTNLAIASFGGGGSMSAAELWKFGTQERAIRGTPLHLTWRVDRDVGGARFTTLRLSGAAAGYQVSAGKILVLTSILFQENSTPSKFNVGYSDSDRGISNAADGANPVNLDTTIGAESGFWMGKTPNVFDSYDVYYEIPANKFPRISAAAGATIVYGRFFGVEI